MAKPFLVLNRRLNHQTGQHALPGFKFERRRENREVADGSLAATYAGDGRAGITRLELIDRSAGGMGVRSRVRIEPGMMVTICPEGSTIPWLAEGAEYRVGIAFSARRAA